MKRLKKQLKLITTIDVVEYKGIKCTRTERVVDEDYHVEVIWEDECGHVINEYNKHLEKKFDKMIRKEESELRSHL